MDVKANRAAADLAVFDVFLHVAAAFVDLMLDGFSTVGATHIGSLADIHSFAVRPHLASVAMAGGR